MNKLVIVGGGAAGMLAALAASAAGAQVMICERNRSLGRKLALTGKGRCNLTNACSVEECINNFPGNGRFLYSALHNFSPGHCREFFTELGVPLKVERGRRVFPVSDKSADIIEALRRRLQRQEVEIRYETRVLDLWAENGRIKGVKLAGENLAADSVIVATGGLSYPATGSTGDGYAWARRLGHSLIATRPSLVPLETAEAWSWTLSGLTLRNVKVTAWRQDRELGSEFGEMLFTHWGVSGPLILSLSRLFSADNPGELSIDLKPALSPEQLEARLQRDLLKFSRKHFANCLHELLPAALIPVVIDLCGIPGDKPANQVTKKERQALAGILRHLPLTITSLRPMSEAVITAGGVSTKEIDPKTMASKLIKGLYFAGEIIDIDGYTGGYNLQAAFATGWTAGMAAIGNSL
jgi:predicted Rossmann fold flavoprotein